MPFGIRMPCHSYVLACYSYVIRIYLYVIRKSLACHPCATLIYSHVMRLSLVCSLMSSLCHSLYPPYITRMYSYVIRMSLVCTRMSSVCRSYVFLPGASHSTLFLFFCLLFFFRMQQILVTLSKLKHMAAHHGVTRFTNNNLGTFLIGFFSHCVQ